MSTFTNSRCPIRTEVFWKPKFESPRTLTRSIHNSLGEFTDTGNFILRVFVDKDIDGFKLSQPFRSFKDHGQNVIQTIENEFDSESILSYTIDIPIKTREKSEAERFHESKVRNIRLQKISLFDYHTSAHENHVSFAAVNGSRLVITAIGITSQRNEFFYCKMNKYNVGLYKFRNKLVIPELPNLTALPGFIGPMVDIKNLPKLAEYKPTETDVVKAGFGKAVVKWSDPFGRRIALQNEKGDLLCPFESVSNHGIKLTNPKPGTVVRVGYLRPMHPAIPTKFAGIARNVYI